MSEFQAFLEAFKDYLDGTEAGIVKLQREIAQLADEKKPEAKVPLNPDKITWKDCRNEKGPFQISEDQTSQEHKTLLNFLKYGGGRVSHEGWFYWIFPDGKIVGRKQTRKEPKP